MARAAGAEREDEDRPGPLDSLASATWKDAPLAQFEPVLTEGDVELTSPPPVHRIVEALLFVGGVPLTAARAGDIIRGLDQQQFLQSIEALNREYRAQGRPYRARPREQGYELALLPKFHRVAERLYGAARETRLSPVALEVLALVAYRQPATKVEIDSVRGADSSSALRQLVRVGLVSVQRAQSSQHEVAYNTTRRFLTLFDLTSLEDLPRTQDPERL